jgi:hypothetical protein
VVVRQNSIPENKVLQVCSCVGSLEEPGIINR